MVSAANPTIRARQSQHGFGQRGDSFLRCEHFDRVCGASAMVGFAALTATLRVQLTCCSQDQLNAIALSLNTRPRKRYG